MAQYKANNGESLKGELFNKKMADGFCSKYKRHFIKTKGGRIYPSSEDYVFVMDGETQKRMLMKELFENNTNLI